LPKKKYFILTTSGMSMTKKNDSLGKAKRFLESKGLKVVGTFGCRGWDSWGPLKLIGGIKRHHPTPDDITAAKKFAHSLLKK